MRISGRNVVQPIREKRDLENCKSWLMYKIAEDSKTNEYSNERNYVLFMTGINTALRVSDLLELTVKCVTNGYISIKERKTGKNNQIEINATLLKLLKNYVDKYDMKPNDYLFKTPREYNKPITRHMVYHFLQLMAKEVGLKYPIGTHTMRKTYGYFFYKETQDIVALKKILNHNGNDDKTVLIYIGMLQDDVDKRRRSFEL